MNIKINKKSLIIFGTLLIVAFASWFTYNILWHSTKANLTTVQQQSRQQNNQKKADVANGKSGGGDSNTAGQGTYTPPTSSNNITLIPEEKGEQVVVTTRLQGFSDGTCNLTITNGGKTVAQTAQVIYQPQFSTCAGFSTPVSSLGTGTWNLSLSVTSDGITNSKTSTLEVK